jgi:hypothetical protein
MTNLDNALKGLSKPGKNTLYLAVQPLIHVTLNQVMGYGLTEQTLTLYPDRNFATEFFPDEVDTYIEAFKWRADKYLTGGHVVSYDLSKEETNDGRIIVRVTQNVRP